MAGDNYSDGELQEEADRDTDTIGGNDLLVGGPGADVPSRVETVIKDVPYPTAASPEGVSPSDLG